MYRNGKRDEEYLKIAQWERRCMMDTWRAIALTLVIVGALNWGLVGLFDFDIVQSIFGGTSTYAASTASRVIYVLVGLSGLYALSFYRFSDEERVPQGEES
jgi:uncharacterized membrane protein YuzA (DUF378 family)